MGKSWKRHHDRGGLLAGLVRTLFAGEESPRRVRHPSTSRSRARTLAYERCEDRCLLAVGISFSTITGELTLTGNGADDSVFLLADSSGLTALINGMRQRLTTANAGNVTSIQYTDAGGTDSLSVAGFKSLAAIDLGGVETLSISTYSWGQLDVTSDVALTLGNVTHYGGLSVTAPGISGASRIVVGKLTALDSTDGVGFFDVSLTGSNNFYSLALRAQNATVRDADSLILSASPVFGDPVVFGDLSILAGRDISQTAASSLTVAGATSLVTSPIAGRVLLGNLGNDFQGPASLTAASATLTDVDALTLGTVAARTAVLRSGGDITQTGPLTVIQLTLIAGPNDVVLNTEANNFGSVAVTSAFNVALRDINAIQLRAMNLAGDLSVATDDGSITQLGALVVAGTTTLDAGGTGSILLNATTNNFSTVAVTTANGSATLTDVNAVDLGASTVNGNLTVTARGAITQSGPLSVTGVATFNAGSTNDVTLLDPANEFATIAVPLARNAAFVDASGGVLLGTSRLVGNLDLTTVGGDIGQTGPVTVSGVTTLNADGGLANITLGLVNNFATIGVVAGDVTLRDGTGLDLGASLVNGNLTVTALGLTQSGPLTVFGDTVLTVGTGRNIALGDPANFFGGSVEIVSAVNVMLVNTGPINFGPGATYITGNLTAEAGGDITQTPVTGTLTVNGTATFIGVNIILDNADNLFNVVALSAAGDATIAEANGLLLGASSVAGALTVTTATGNIGQNGDVMVGGLATLTAGPASSILLGRPGNDFANVVLSAQNATISDVNDLEIDTSVIPGNLTATAGGAIFQGAVDTLTVGGTARLTGQGGILLDNPGNDFATLSLYTPVVAAVRDDLGGVILGPSNVTGLAVITSTGGDITGTTLVNLSIAVFDAGIDNIILTGQNDFGTVEINAANNVALADINGLDFAASVVAGDLDVSTNGPISQSGDLAVGGNTTLSAHLADIALDSLANQFAGTVGVTSARNVALADSLGDLDLAASHIIGNLAAQATAGGIAQTGDVVAFGKADLAAATDVVLGMNNDFGTLAAIAGNVTFNDVNGVYLGDCTLSGDLDVTASGMIYGSGVLSIAGSTTLTAQSGASFFDVLLYNTASSYGGPLALTGRWLIVDTTNAVVVSVAFATASVDITALDGITLDGAGVMITGNLTLDADNNPLVVNNASLMVVGGTVTYTGNPITINP